MLQRRPSRIESNLWLQLVPRGLLGAWLALSLATATKALGAEPPDLVGIYWDTGGASNTVVTSEPWELVVGYIVVKNLSSPDGLRAVAFVNGAVPLGTTSWSRVKAPYTDPSPTGGRRSP